MLNDQTERKLRNMLLLVAAIISFAILIAVNIAENCDVPPSGRGEYISLSDWTMVNDATDEVSEIHMPYTLEFEGDQSYYTLSTVVPPVTNTSENTFRIYSNYMDVDFFLDGELKYSHHVRDYASFGASGNEFHYFDLPISDEEHTITVKIRCQLGDSTDYYLRPALLGSKTGMFVDDTISCIPVLLLCVLLVFIGISAFILRITVKATFGPASYITFFGLFAILFSLYTFLETELALFILKNSRFVYMAKFMLLCILQIPLMETIIVHILPKYKHFGSQIVYFNVVNFIFQTFLHFTGNLDYCAMLPLTHAITAISFIPMIIFLLKTGVHAYPYLVAVFPMYIGFLLDAFLIYIGMPSYHNNFWFTLSLSIYIVFEIIRLLRMYMYKFHQLVESNTLETLAYTDLLTGLGNRNAYEEHIKALNETTPSETLGCIVSDLTDLKGINDTRGHGSGDLALIEISEAIRHQIPANASCFRTGGDEFIIMIDSIDEHTLSKLAQRIKFDVSERAQVRHLPLMLSMGYGLYHPSDENVPDFIRRIDTLMYADKRAQKQRLALARAAEESKL